MKEEKEKQEKLSSIFVIIELDDLFEVGIDRKIKNISQLKKYIEEHNSGKGVSRREIIENSNNSDIEKLIEEAKLQAEIVENDEGNLKVMFWTEEKVE